MGTEGEGGKKDPRGRGERGGRRGRKVNRTRKHDELSFFNTLINTRKVDASPTTPQCAPEITGGPSLGGRMGEHGRRVIDGHDEWLIWLAYETAKGTATAISALYLGKLGRESQFSIDSVWIDRPTAASQRGREAEWEISWASTSKRPARFLREQAKATGVALSMCSETDVRPTVDRRGWLSITVCRCRLTYQVYFVVCRTWLSICQLEPGQGGLLAGNGLGRLGRRRRWREKVVRSSRVVWSSVSHPGV